MMMETY